MEEDNITIEETKTSRCIFDNKCVRWFKNMDTRSKLIIEVSVLIIIVVIGALFYWKSLNIGLFYNGEQLGNNNANLTEKEKINILKSLSGDSISTDLSAKKKHKELNQLSKQSENTNQLKESDKMNVLDNLSQ